jgi:tetratricopeptide (TPR) repeat protein
VARKGVGKLKPSGGRGSASEDWRKAMRESDERERNRYGGKRQTEPETWIDEGPVRDEARAAVQRGTAKPARKRPAKELPEEVRAEAARAAGPAWADRVQDRLRDAMRAYERERYQDARKLLVPLAERAPGSIAVRELLGLTWYRMGRWKDAIKELEVVELLGGGTVEHHPVLMDCHRALKHHGRVAELFEELRKGGPAVDVMIEGRIVYAGDLADRGETREAIAVLEQGPVGVKRPRDHHLRLWYALASMYERGGDVPRARRLFGRVLEADPEFADAASRYDALT